MSGPTTGSVRYGAQRSSWGLPSTVGMAVWIAILIVSVPLLVRLPWWLSTKPQRQSCEGSGGPSAATTQLFDLALVDFVAGMAIVLCATVGMCLIDPARRQPQLPLLVAGLLGMALLTVPVLTLWPGELVALLALLTVALRSPLVFVALFHPWATCLLLAGSRVMALRLIACALLVCELTMALLSYWSWDTAIC